MAFMFKFALLATPNCWVEAKHLKVRRVALAQGPSGLRRHTSKLLLLGLEPGPVPVGVRHAAGAVLRPQRPGAGRVDAPQHGLEVARVEEASERADKVEDGAAALVGEEGGLGPPVHANDPGGHERVVERPVAEGGRGPRGLPARHGPGADGALQGVTDEGPTEEVGVVPVGVDAGGHPEVLRGAAEGDEGGPRERAPLRLGVAGRSAERLLQKVVDRRSAVFHHVDEDQPLRL